MQLKEIKNTREAQEKLRALGVTPKGIEIMAPKMLGRVVELSGLDPRGANMLKQNALSLGGDLALPETAYELKGRKTRGILMGNREQIVALVGKLAGQPYGLRQVGRDLRAVLQAWSAVTILRSRGRRLSLAKPVVMGVLNVTPDSFSDGGEFYAVSERKRIDKALRQVEKMIKEGVQIIDIGGESTGPGSKAVTLEEEWQRIEGVLKKARKLTDRAGVWLSIDTYKAEIVRRALESGVDMVNDVTALRGDCEMAAVVAGAKVPVVLMYAKDSTPRTSLKKTRYKDVMLTVKEFLLERIDFVVAAGIKREKIIVDPGMGGFVSKDPKYSLEILQRLAELKRLDQPILVGASRKSFLAGPGGLPVRERLEGSLAAAEMAIQNGAKIVRAHDVKETRRVLDLG